MTTTKKCPHCKLDVFLGATKCPNCQSDLRSWGRRHPIITFFIIIISIQFVIAVVHDTNSDSTPVSKEESILEMKKHDFASLAKMNVKTTLKSPSTAKFSTSPKVTFDGKDFLIESWVDSENSFGANIRSYWSMKAHYIGGDTSEEAGTGKNWIIDEFIFDGDKVKI